MCNCECLSLGDLEILVSMCRWGGWGGGGISNGDCRYTLSEEATAVHCRMCSNAAWARCHAAQPAWCLVTHAGAACRATCTSVVDRTGSCQIMGSLSDQASSWLL